VWWNYSVLHDQRTRCHNRAFANPGIVQYDCADAYQAVVLDRTGVKHRAVPHRDPIAYGHWRALETMRDGSVLDVRVGSHAYGRDVTAQHHLKPNACVFANFHIPDDVSAPSHKCRGRNARFRLSQIHNHPQPTQTVRSQTANLLKLSQA
jgi:hypothetical protein